MSDPGLIMLVRDRWPDLPIHLSVQANTMNSASVRFWQRQGLTRVILSRELSLEQIEAIRQAVPDMELEVFVHGALCIAYSGRCLLSGYFNHRDANQGTCTNACRWEYRVNQAPSIKPEELGRHPQADQVHYIEEPGRPGEFMPIEEDEHGTYILNSRDLRAVEHVQRLVEIGVDCLKIEGRTKSHYYTAQTTRVYRQAIDDALSGRPFDPYQRHESAELQNYRQGASSSRRARFVAEVLDAESGLVEVKNRFQTGDTLELITPTGSYAFVLEEIRDSDGNPIQAAPGSGWKVHIPFPVQPHPCSLVVQRLDGPASA